MRGFAFGRCVFVCYVGGTVGRSPSGRVRGATAAAVQQQSLRVSDMSPKIRFSAAVTLIPRGSYRISQLWLLLTPILCHNTAHNLGIM